MISIQSVKAEEVRLRARYAYEIRKIIMENPCSGQQRG
jgi:hypothetical protein